jgi:hypothetical protein
MVYPMLWMRKMWYRSPEIQKDIFLVRVYFLLSLLITYCILLCSCDHFCLSSNSMSHERVIVKKLEDYEWKNIFKRVH